MISLALQGFSAAKGAYCHSWRPKLDPWDLHDGRKEPSPVICPLISAHVQTHTYIQIINKHNFKNKNKNVNETYVPNLSSIWPEF